MSAREGARAFRLLIAVLGLAAATACESPDTRVANVVPATGPVADVRALLDRGAYSEADSLARATLAQLSATGKGRSLEAGELTDGLLVALARGGRAAAPDAAELADEAVAIKREVLGARHPSVATSLDNGGWLFFVRGEYALAQQRYEEALAILDSAAAADPQYRIPLATVHSHLGPLYQELGRYSTSRQHYEIALEAFVEALGAGDRTVAMSRNNLATLLVKVGDYAPALALYRQSLETLQGQLGSEHPLIATSKHNQAELQQRMGRTDDAVALYRESLRTKEQTLGPEHPSVALTLGNLSYLYADREEGPAADSLAERAVHIQETALGPEHVDVAYGLVSLGRARSVLGDHRGARAALERALELRTRTLGERHPLLVFPLYFLAEAVAREGNRREALELALRAEDISREHLRLTARGAPDRQALRYAAERLPSLDLALSLATGLDEPSATTRAWDALIRSRAVVLDEMAVRQRLANDIGTPDAREALDAYRAAAERLSNVLLRGPAGDVGRYAQQVELLRDELEDAERSVAMHSGAAGSLVVATGFEEVRSALPPNATLVAYTRTAPRAGASAELARYVAFVLDGPRGSPRIVDLGAARDVETATRRWRDQMVPEAPARDPNGHLAVGARLRELIWDPLGIDATGDRLVLIVPDGALHLVNFAALQGSDGRMLAEADVLIHQLSSERDVVADVRPGARRELLAVGGVEPRASRRRQGSGGESAGQCLDVSTEDFPVLPASLSEVRGIASIWNRAVSARASEVLEGARATEAAFKREAQGKAVVHLATHGFFSPNDCWTDPTAGTSPLHLSGLVFTADDTEGSSDGVLLAEEVAALDLSQAQWVVLSGCDTGLGSIQVDEGILGLRRAFDRAGAGTVIMSLWPVEDVSAEVFMHSLYQARFEQLASTAEAMRQAYREALAATRRGRGHAHPLYWAAFIASGDWR